MYVETVNTPTIIDSSRTNIPSIINTHSIDINHQVPFEDKSMLKLALSEFVGSFIFIYIAIAGVNQCVLTSLESESDVNQIQVAICFALGLTSGVCLSKYSGGHLNPAISFSIYLFEYNFTFNHLVIYMISQLTGGICAGLLSILIYYSWLDKYNDELVVGTYGTLRNPNNDIFPAIIDQFIGSLLLMFGIMNVSNIRCKPFIIGLILGGLALFQGSNGFAFNMARDLGPRIASTILFGSISFSSMDYWFYIPIIIPFLGAPVGYLLSYYI
jgi:aquaglyceroporin related protein